MREMRADLMCFSRMQENFRLCKLTVAFPRSVFRDDFFRAEGRSVVNADEGFILVFFQISGENSLLLSEFSETERTISLFYPPFLKCGEELFLRLFLQSKNEQARGVSIQTMQKETFSLPLQSRKHRFRIDAAFLVGDENVFVLINDIKSGFFFLGAREIVSDLIARGKEDILSDLFSVDADLSVFYQIIPEKRTLRVSIVGIFF